MSPCINFTKFGVEFKIGCLLVQLDNKLLSKYFKEHHHDNLPDFSDKVMFSIRGIDKLFCKFIQ